MKKNKYSLVGIDGNAFSVMGYVTSAMRKERMSKAEQNEYMCNAQKKDYNHLLAVSLEMIDKLNNR